MKFKIKPKAATVGEGTVSGSAVPGFRECCGATIERLQRLSRRYKGLATVCECGGQIKLKS